MSHDEIALIRRAAKNYLEARLSTQAKRLDIADGLRSLDLFPSITIQDAQLDEFSSLAGDWRNVGHDLWVAINKSSTEA